MGDDSKSKGVRWPWWAVGGLIVVSIGVVGFVSLSDDGNDQSDATESRSNTAQVMVADLTDQTTYSGTLGRPEPEQLLAGFEGTVTWVPDNGTIVEEGDRLFSIDETPVILLEGEAPAYRDFQLGDTRVLLPAGSNGVLTWLLGEGEIIENGTVIAKVDEEPVVLLEGDIPMYRILRDGVEGEDVHQLETALVALGYDPDGDVTVDEEFTNSTESMVEAWQEDLGVDESGRVEPGDVIFAPVPGQVASHQAAVGSSVSPTSPILDVSGGDYLMGSDVLQLEKSLEALGYDPGFVDGTYDISTAEAVKEWTDAMGHGEDGRLPVGSVVFQPSGLRSSDVLASAGTSVGPTTPVMNAAALETIVRIDLPAEDQELVSLGTPVVIELPDQTEISGAVTFVSGTATSGGPGEPATFDVEISLDDPSAAGDLDEAPVDVKIVTDSVQGVKAVPVSALLALAEGGYAVEVVDGDETRLVAVEPGFFADGLVEIDGSVEAGDVVVTP